MSRLASLVVAGVIALGGLVSAQTPAGGRLIVTVVDQSGGVIPSATVTVTGLETATKAAAVSPIKTTDKGVATFDRLGLGHYSIAAEFPGFTANLLKDVTIKAGDNKHVVVLALKAMQDSATVTQDRQSAGSDRGVLFGTALTREQIDALSDDPAEMRRQLIEMAGGDATIRVDSFEGQDLPTKAQIKSIHITRDQFAAESHTAGGTFIDIITQPGIGAIRTSVNGSFHNSAMEARNPLAPKKGPARDANWGGSIGGTLIKDHATFSLNAGQGSGYSTPNLYASAPGGGTLAENLNLHATSSSFSSGGLLDYTLTKDQTLRVSFSQFKFTNGNQGVGNLDYIERAYSSEQSQYGIRMTEAGPLGRRFFINTRFSISASDSSSHSVSEATVINVLDAFRAGGAQQRGGRHTKNLLLASDLDYVRGRNSWRTGFQVEGTLYHADAQSNYNGTYTFESLDAYQANTPRSFTQSVGDPNISYTHAQVGLYLQDDIRLRKNLSLSPGVRVEVQTHLKDYSNISPRFGATWSPFKSGRTSLRGSWGIFYDWLSSGIYQQTIQNDPAHLSEINVVNPGYPDPGAIGVASPVNRYQFGPDLRMVRNTRYAASVNQSLLRRVSISATASYVRAVNLLVGSNLNAPVGGLRPNPALANVYETNSDGRSVTKSLSTSVSLSLSRLAPASGSSPVSMPAASVKRFDWRRSLSLRASYFLGRSENNTDGAFAVPATGNLATEWGPSLGDIRHRVNGGISSSALKNLGVSFNFNWSSAPPLNIRTGTDDNGDLIFNDRPAGVGRNSARTIPNWNTSMSLNYSLGFGKAKQASAPPGVMVMNGGMVMMAAGAAPAGAQSTPKYRLSLSVFISNLTNHATYSGFSGVITSPFYLKHTTAFGQRSISLNTFLSF